MSDEISIRPARPDDIGFVLEAQADPEAAPNIGSRPGERHLESIAGADEELLIVTAAGRPVGYALLTDLSGSNRNFEIHTIVIAERGQGFGQAALRLILDRGFDVHGAHRMWLDAVGNNDRARHVYEKIGFTYEGAWREAWHADDGSWQALIFLGMLDREWAAIRGRGD
jgi:diamine N-acetyltransferase